MGYAYYITYYWLSLMVAAIKRQLMNVAEILHLRIFGHGMSDEMRKFIGNLGWMSMGMTLSMGFLFITNLMAGRWLGPAEYGKYSLMISLGQLFIVPMMLGLNTATIRYVAAENDKRKIIAAAIVGFLACSLVSLSIFIACEGYLAEFLKIDNSLYVVALVYAVVLAMKYMGESILKGYHYFKELSWLAVVNALVIFTLFFLLAGLFGERTFIGYSIATIGGLLVYIGYVFWRRMIAISEFDGKHFNKLISYGGFATVGSISGLLIGNVDRFILNSYLGIASVGIYSVYLSASSFLSGQVVQIFVDVFFPSVSAITEKRQIVRKIEKMFVLSFVPLALANMAIVAIIVKLYGDKFEFNLIHVALFSMIGTLSIFQNILWWLIASLGKKGIRFTSFSGIILGVLNVSMLIFLVKKWYITGAALAILATSLLMIGFAIIYLKKAKYE